jgi:hypothetical protein
MPVEILELIVKATIEQPKSSDSESGSTDGEIEKMDTKAIIEECVAQVMEILRQQKER